MREGRPTRNASSAVHSASVNFLVSVFWGSSAAFSNGATAAGSGTTPGGLVVVDAGASADALGSASAEDCAGAGAASAGAVPSELVASGATTSTLGCSGATSAVVGGTGSVEVDMLMVVEWQERNS